MKQVITQHGWGLDQSFWDNYKIDFKEMDGIGKIMKEDIFQKISIKQNGYKTI